MRCKSPVETLIEGRRKQLGISFRELAVTTVGCERTLHNRMLNPMSFLFAEICRLFKCLQFTDEMKEEFYQAMEEFGEGGI